MRDDWFSRLWLRLLPWYDEEREARRARHMKAIRTDAATTIRRMELLRKSYQSADDRLK